MTTKHCIKCKQEVVKDETDLGTLKGYKCPKVQQTNICREQEMSKLDIVFLIGALLMYGVFWLSVMGAITRIGG